MAKSRRSPLAELEAHAETIRAELKVPKQNELFRAAVEAGYLAAAADGDVDATERATIARAVEILSVGAVIEWEAETLLEECEKRVKEEGTEKRAAAVGGELKALGYAETGLYMAALVARATNGVEKSEAEMLKAVGTAAGLSVEKVRGLVKRAATALT
jgi:tellurite resistance protein